MKNRVETEQTPAYRVKMVISLEIGTEFATHNELLMPEIHTRLNSARKLIAADMKRRLQRSYYFRSQKKGFDLVRYNLETRLNTYITYRVVKTGVSEKKLTTK